MNSVFFCNILAHSAKRAQKAIFSIQTRAASSEAIHEKSDKNKSINDGEKEASEERWLAIRLC